MKEPIVINALSSISSLGISLEEVWNGYISDSHFLKKERIGGVLEWISPLPKSAKKEILILRNSNSKYRNLDDSVLFAIYASRNAVAMARWQTGDNFGVNLGSSRGATGLFEKYHSEFVQRKTTATLSSPTTTLGNISSWVAHDLQTQGPELSHSITCSTALHSLLNGVAWLRSGMATKFLVGGSEAPLTPFTLAQMHAMKIYAVRPSRTVALSSRAVNAKIGDKVENYPCQTLHLDKRENTMVLGEGASVACLEMGITKKTLAVIEGVGYATEILEHNISISAEAKCFQKSMKMALGEIDPKRIDAIVMHAPGTIKGDLSEYKAIQKVFGKTIPAMTSNKWKIGHTFGASGMLSIELAVLMLKNQVFIKVPFVPNGPVPKKLDLIMVNAVGFGGNAVSILFSRPDIRY